MSELLEVLQGGLVKVIPKRLSVSHLEHRDQALDAIERAQKAAKRLSDLERGEVGDPIRSPRFDAVRQIETELHSLLTRLDGIYT